MPFILTLLLLFAPFSLATSPPIQLATKFHEQINIQDYWVSEKLDGVRAYWDGKHLISRQGNHFKAPEWFTKDFPNTTLDGELWIAREKFERVSGIVRSNNMNDWQEISFMIFDLPNSPENFTQRLHTMKQIVNNSHTAYLRMIPQYKVASREELQIRLDGVINAGGEGLMLHHINAYYQAKRSKDLMKLKRYDDAEAIVLSHIAGKGKHHGRMGSLVVKTSEGITFKIGSGFSDKERENPPNIGDTITYQYIGKTKNGVPRFASYLRTRFLASP